MTAGTVRVWFLFACLAVLPSTRALPVSDAAPRMQIRLADGSVLWADPATNEITLATEYGTALVPLEKLSSINLNHTNGSGVLQGKSGCGCFKCHY